MDKTFCIASPHKNELWYDYRVYKNLRDSLSTLGYSYQSKSKNRIYFLGGELRKFYPEVGSFDQNANNIAVVYSHFHKVSSLLGFNKIFVPSEYVKDYFLQKRKDNASFFKSNAFLKKKSMLGILKPFSSLTLNSTDTVFEECDLCFLGSPRIRPIVEDIIPIVEKHNLNFSLYGPGWHNYDGNPAAKKYLKKSTIRYEDFPNLAKSAKIVLIDHHSEMNQIGAVSHKYVDHLLSGALLISDNNRDARDFYKGLCYESPKELESLVLDLIADKEYREKQRQLQYQVSCQQTSLNAAKLISQCFL